MDWLRQIFPRVASMGRGSPLLWALSLSLLLVGLLLLLPLVFFVMLRLGALTPAFNLLSDRLLQGRTPAQVRVGSLRSDLVSFIEADDVVLLAPRGDAKVPLMTIATLRFEYSAWDAWRGRIDPEDALKLARIKGLNVFMHRDARGNWNLKPLFPGGGGKRERKAGKATKGLAWIPAGRVELDDSRVVFNDEALGFHSTVSNLQGSLDTRALPMVAFSLSGRTEGVGRDNLSLAGEADLRGIDLDGRLDLAQVELKSYLNYLLPAGGLRFEGGRASLSARVRVRPDEPLVAEGRADLSDGRLRIPGVERPLDAIRGLVTFNPQSLRFRSVSGRFLDSTWKVKGALNDLRQPRFEVELENEAVPLAAVSGQVRGLAPLGLSGTASLKATLRGPARRPRIEGAFLSQAVQVAGVTLEKASARVVLEGLSLDVEDLRAGLWGGSLEGGLHMGLARTSSLQAELVLDGARLEEAQVGGVRPLPISGTAFLELKARGPVRTPNLSLHLEVAKAAMGSLPLGTVKADARWDAEGLGTKFSLMGGSLEGSLAMRRKDWTFHDTRLELRRLDLDALSRGVATAPPARVLPAGAPAFAERLRAVLQGRIDASVSVDGPLKEPTVWFDLRSFKGGLFLTRGALALAEPSKPLDLEADGALGFSRGEVMSGKEGQPLRLSLSHKGRTMEAKALGRYPIQADGRAGSLELGLDADLRLLDAWAVFRRSQGRASFDGFLGGSMDAPLARGLLKVDSFATEPEAFLAPVKNGRLRLQLEDRIVAVDLTFSAGERVEVKGRMDLSAGLRGLAADLEARTQGEGLRFQNWEGMGSGSVALDPLRVKLQGEDKPLELSGRLRLANALVVYGGRGAADSRPAAAEGASPPGKRRPLALDLKVGLGANVWYQKQHQASVDIFNPAQWLQGAADSVMETLQRPDLFFRLKPTEQDFVISGQAPGVQLKGELAIDRGRLSLMENDFEIKPDRKSPMIRFNGEKAEVYAVAVARMRYNRDDPLTSRPQVKAVNVVVDVAPLPEEELAKSDLAGQFLNYRLEFTSEPEIMKDDPVQQREAILNLVVLGDPMVDEAASMKSGQVAGSSGAAAAAQAAQRSGRLQETQINRILSAEVRKQAAALAKRGFKFLGTGFIDVFRVVPRFKYQAVNSQAAKAVGTVSASEANKQAQESQLMFSDITFELGKSLGDKFYGSVQFIQFNEAGTAGQTQAAGKVNRITRDKGARAGIEYQISPNRTAEAFWNYSVDDNLEPVPFDPADLLQAHSGVVRLRNTIPTGNYSAGVARNRRWDKEGQP